LPVLTCPQIAGFQLSTEEAALNQLLELHFPKTSGRAVCIIRPQWAYNLKYVSLSAALRDLIAPAVLDPNMSLPATTPDEIPSALWKWRLDQLPPEMRSAVSMEPPKHIAVLSFAGLDTHDALFYPILAHELGHFIDYSFNPALNLSPSIIAKTQIPFVEVVNVITAKAPAALPQAGEIWQIVVQRVATCVRELLADLLALRMIGFGFFAAHTELLKTIAPWPDTEPLVTASGYPAPKFRLWSVLRHLLSPGFPGNPREFLTENPPPPDVDLTTLEHYLDEWVNSTKYGPALTDTPATRNAIAEHDIHAALGALTANAILSAYDEIVSVATQTISDAASARLAISFFERVQRLKADLPATPRQEKANSFAEIMSAGWAYQLTYGESRERALPEMKTQFREYEKTCNLLMKSIELMPPSNQPPLSLPTTEDPEIGAVLSRSHICTRLQLAVSHERYLGVVPIDVGAIEASSLDVHLGNWFVAMRRTRLPSVQLGQQSSEDLLARVGRDETFVPSDGRYLIHPGDLVLGATLEFFALPSDVMAFVEGKSKWGRLGLIVATASQVAPGFHGVVVLEFANAGTVPLELKPGLAIAQIVFQRMSENLPPADLYRGKYYCQIKPQ
jgi:dCTP deaminase